MLADWRARLGVGGREDDPAGGGATGNDDGGDIAPEFVKWVSRDHTRPCVALDKSPFFPGVLLSVGDWSFQIWKVIMLKYPGLKRVMAYGILWSGLRAALRRSELRRIFIIIDDYHPP